MMVRRVVRMFFALFLGRAWAQRSPKWLSLAGLVLVFRSLDRLAIRAGRRASGKPST